MKHTLQRSLALLALLLAGPSIVAGRGRAQGERDEWRVLDALDLESFLNASPGQEERFAPFAAAHEAGVRKARERLIQELWEAAPAERRAAVVELFRRYRRPYDRAVTTPTPEALAESWRILNGGAPVRDGGEWPARLLDSLDLRVAPGAFEAREDGLGEPTTVHVRALFPTELEGTVELSLYWLSRSGEELRARTEPIEAAAFRGPGFEMYVRPPASAPATWRLVAGLEVGERSYRGIPVEVECIEDLRGRVAGLIERAEREPRSIASEARPWLEAWIGHGVRPTVAVPLSRWLELAAETPATAASGGIAPLRLEGFAGGRHVFWTFEGEERAGRGPILLLATGGGEHPLELLTGPLGRRWLALERELDALLIASDFPAVSQGGGPTVQQLADFLASGDGGREVVVIARGDRGVLLPGRMREGGPGGASRLVLCGQAAGARPNVGLGIPVLALDALAPTEERRAGGEERERWTWIRRTEPAFLADLAAPAEIAAWCAGEGRAAEERAPR